MTAANRADLDEDRGSANQSSLDALYPFLGNPTTDLHAQTAALHDSVIEKISQHQRVISEFFTTQRSAVVECARAIAQAYRADGTLFAMGNGGSSADAAHITVEFLHPVTTGRPALPAYDLSCDKTVLTALANDVGFESVYSRQVANLLRSKDVLVGISTSGNSKNLVKAFLQAKSIGAATIGLAGGNGGEMATLKLDHCLIVPTDSIHRTQECHVAIYHVLWDLVHTLLASDRGSQAKARTPSKDNSNEIR